MEAKLHKFNRLAEIGSYTKAAKELHISQPALSVAIQKLERSLGTELFIRTGRRLQLTATGRAVYQATLDHQDVTSHLHESLDRLASKRPTITIGMIDSVADVVCASEAFDCLEQSADVTVIVNNSKHLREGVERRYIDTAFLIDDDLEHSGLVSEPLGTERLMLVFSPNIADDVNNSTQKHRLEHFISYDKPSTTYRHIQRAFALAGIHTRTRLYSTSPIVMLGMVLRGKGCAVLPENMVDQAISDGRLLTALSPILRPIATVSVANKSTPQYLADFIAQTQQLMSRADC